MERTALLIRCSKDEAERIRVEAEKQRRTISAYVLHIMSRMIEIEDRLFGKMNPYSPVRQVVSRKSLIGAGPRTAILVRCSVFEAERIREAAHRRDFSINAYVLQALKRAWASEVKSPLQQTANQAPRQSASASQA